jgi:hypothetical protein
MAGLDPAIPARPVRNRLAAHSPGGDGRVKPGHDEPGRVNLSVIWYYGASLSAVAQVFVTSQNTGNGAFTTPDRLFRQA